MKKIYFSIFFLFILSIAKSQTLIGITPNQGNVGSTVTAIITGQNTFFMSGSPQGIHSFFLGSKSTAYSCPLITGSNIHALNDDSVSVNLNIPANLGNGVYDLYITTSLGADLNL